MKGSRFPDPLSLAPDPVLDVLKKSDSGTPQKPTLRHEPVTFVGRSLLQHDSGHLQQRIDELETERERGRTTGAVLLKLDPKLVGPSRAANRHELSLKLADEKFAELLESIRKYGQDTPIVVRPAPPESAPIQYEIVEGHRRHGVCILLDRETDGGFFVEARLIDAAKDERTHFLRMFRENFLRENLSPFEQGRMFVAALADRTRFANQGELAESCQISVQTVSKYMQVAQLPARVLVAFKDPRAISLRWAPDLMAALKSNEQAVLERADELALRDPSPLPSDVCRELVHAGATTGRRPSPSREEAIKIGGQVAFRLNSRSGRVAIRFGKMVDKKRQKELEAAIKEVTEKVIRSWDG